MGCSKKIKIELMRKFKFINLQINNRTLTQNKSIYFNREKLFKTFDNKINFESFLKNVIKYTFPKFFRKLLQFRIKLSVS